MHRLTLLIAIALAASGSGCAGRDVLEPGDPSPEQASPTLFAKKEKSVPERYIEWDASSVEARPSLRPLSQVLAEAKDDEASVKVTEQESRDITAYVRDQWQAKYPGTMPSPAIIRYEGSYYAIALAI